ncbi:MAG: hypothetical protein GT601_17610 [Acidaminobacter sp.]|uniref:portal protein n=1 Tax=Acidaminobacter sp. TaxID=1872102 RepID=UPI0013824890|nr:hypothetical protein [Acidaminobacter sp.]MZQ99487.1 hypothetical protein [Acidaminobacter sp.]
MAKSVEHIKPDKDAQTPAQIERCKLVDERSEDGAHSDEDLQSYVQLAYYAGHQHIAMSPTTKQIVPLPKEDWQVQYTANRILPAVRNELSKVLRHKLSKAVVPATTEEADIRSARIADKVVEWLEYDLKLQEVDEEVVMWALATRIGFVKPVWNPAKGLTIATEDGRPVKQGDVDIEVLNLFEVKWDPSASRWSDVRWIIHERQRTIEYIKAVYGKEVAADDTLTAASIYEGKLKTLTSGSNIFGSKSVKARNCAVVKEYWESPSHEYPKGRRITVAGGVELWYEEDIGFGEKDNTDREIPIFPLIHIPVPGKVIGTSIVEQLIPVQREYNKSRGQIIENKNLMANPKWAAEDGAIIDDEIDSAPGTVIWYRKGFNPPIMLQPASLGADVYKNVEQCIEEFMYISSQQEVSHGSTPTGVNSGVAIQLLQEQDDTKLAPTVAKYGRFKQKYMSYLLKIIRFKYDEARTVQLVGQNKRMESLEFRGSDLTSTDIRFEDMSLTQLSNAARKQYVLELINMQVLNPQMDRDLIIRMLELGITDDLYDGLEIDVQQALNENAAWAKLDFSPITRDFFHHEVHVAQHNKFRKGAEYEGMDPESQSIIDAHIQEHMTYIMQAMMQASPAQVEADDTGDLDMGRVIGALSPEEQAAIKQDPTILDAI